MNSSTIGGPTDNLPPDGADLRNGLYRRQDTALRFLPFPGARRDPVLEAAPLDRQLDRARAAYRMGYRAGFQAGRLNGWASCEAVYDPAMQEGAR